MMKKLRQLVDALDQDCHCDRCEPSYIQDAENGFVYCSKCQEKAEECRCK